MEREKILELVRRDIAAALEKEIEEIPVDASLSKDLGAESIDLIDLTFRLERTFGIQIPEGELFDRKPGPFSGPADHVDEVVEFVARRLPS